MSHYPALEISDLHYRYPDGTAALNGIDLRVAEGEKVGLLGANGAGKSTLLLHINGILSGRGDIRVFGIAVGKSTLREIRRRVGLIFQNPDDQLFCPSVFDDVAFGPRQMGLGEQDVAARVRHAVEETGLDPDLLKKNAAHLSFGQKKLAAMATVLSMDARILVFDEPTIGLDPRARRLTMELLHHLGRTQIIATHDLDMARDLCDRVVIMDRGQCAAQGPARDILADADLIERCALA